MVDGAQHPRPSLAGAAVFVAATYASSWVGVIMGQALVATVMPAIVAVLVQHLVNRKPIMEPLGICRHVNLWFLVGWLAPLGISLATLAVGLLLPGVRYAPPFDAAGYAPFATMILIVLGDSLLARGFLGLGEEVGWRGYLQKELGWLGFWRASYVIGALWGFWHAPAILLGTNGNYPEHPVIGVFLMIANGALLSPLIAYVRLKSQSVIAAGLMHGSLTSCLRLAVVFVEGGTDLSVGVFGVAGLIVLAMSDALLCLATRHSASQSGGLRLGGARKVPRDSEP